jgi:MSHA biogenesis protein MshO
MSRFAVSRTRGFTLVEVIVVMVITSILAGIMVLFIRRPVENYVNTAARADIADAAEIALRRMARELRGAVPNSIRLSVIGNTSLLEFIPTKAGGNYLDVSDGAPAANPVLSFTDTTRTNFYVVTPVPAAPYAIVPGDWIIVYNLGAGNTGSDAYAANPGNRAAVAAIGGANGKTITLTNNPFPNGLASPSKRFSVALAPVTFACVNNANGTGTLTRLWGYGFRPAQINPATVGATQALMANNVAGCTFTVMQLLDRNTSLIGLAIALARPSPGSAANNLETATLVQQIQVSNTP